MLIFRKIAKLVLVIIVIAVLLSGVVFYLAAERIMKIGIETAGTRALNVGVTIDDVELSILGGKAVIENLTVSNPPGYNIDNLLELGKARVQLDVGSLMGDTVNIDEIMLDGVNLSIEQKGLSNNLHDVMSSIPKSKTEAADSKGKKLRIKNLEITNITVNVKVLPLPGHADTIPLKLSRITMTNLGGDEKLSTARLTRTILLVLADSVAQQGAGILPDGIIGPIKSKLDMLKAVPGVVSEEAKKFLEGAKDIGQSGKKVIDTGTDLGKGITDAFKGLLKPKEENK